MRVHITSTGSITIPAQQTATWSCTGLSADGAALAGATATYDREADAISVWLNRGTYAFSLEVAQGVFVDYDASGFVIGVEILGVTALPQPAAETGAETGAESDEAR